MIWSLRINAAARRDIRKLKKSEQHEVAEAIRSLAYNPEPEESDELEDYHNYRKVKIGRFRIMYRVGRNKIYVFRIERRSKRTYRGFNPEE